MEDNTPFLHDNKLNILRAYAPCMHVQYACSLSISYACVDAQCTYDEQGSCVIIVAYVLLPCI